MIRGTHGTPLYSNYPPQRSGPERPRFPTPEVLVECRSPIFLDEIEEPEDMVLVSDSNDDVTDSEVSTVAKIAEIVKLVGTAGIKGDLDYSLAQAVSDIALIFAMRGCDLGDDQLETLKEISGESGYCCLKHFLTID